MFRLGKPLARLPTYALRRRIRSNQVRVLSFELLELLHKQIEVGIADLGIVENVIAVFVMSNLITKSFDFAFESC